MGRRKTNTGMRKMQWYRIVYVQLNKSSAAAFDRHSNTCHINNRVRWVCGLFENAAAPPRLNHSAAPPRPNHSQRTKRHLQPRITIPPSAKSIEKAQRTIENASVKARIVQLLSIDTGRHRTIVSTTLNK